MNKRISFKEIRIKFYKLTAAHEQLILKFVNGMILDKSARLDDYKPPTPEQNREDFRVLLHRCNVDMVTDKTEKLDVQHLSAEVIDISVGGMCVKLAADVKLVRNSFISLHLHFVETEPIVRGIILGLQYSD